MNSPTVRPGWLLEAAALVVRADGIRLLGLATPPAWEVMPPAPALTPDQLDLLLRHRRAGSTAALADDVNVEPSRVAALADLLEAAGLLGNAPASTASPPVVRPSPPSAPRREELLQVHLPFVLGVGPGGYEVVDHDGVVRAQLTAAELLAVLAVAQTRSVEAALDRHHRDHPDRPVDSTRFDVLIDELVAVGAITGTDGSVPDLTAGEEELRQAFLGAAAFRQHANQLHADHDAAEAARGVHPRIKVVPVQVAGNIPPLSTGMVLAYAQQHDSGRLAETYDLHPRWITAEGDAPSGDEVVVYLFTNYLWSHERNLEFAKALKQANPRALTIHGGPDCPSHEGDLAAYFGANPQVDVAVRGEGEVAASEVLAALAPSIRAGRPDLAALADVPGLAYRDGDAMVRTADRPRIEDVDAIPSPYAAGVFDAFGYTKQMTMAIIETNRGCPYGCTFCDWGSATNSRIRKFDLDRVFDEFTWCAQHAVPKIFVADANFGIFSRDVDIAHHVVALKREYGFPQRFITNYAKNTVKHLKEIVTILAEGGILSEGLLSLQSMDSDTLLAIRRSNIKLEKYEALSKEFREASVPLFVDLMMGLPGQTVDSLRRDLQQCVDREVNAKCHQTELLVNSPMNDPEYRVEHEIEVSRPPGATGLGVAATANLGPAYVVATSTFSRSDYQQMHLMRRSYLLAENFGVLRQVTRFVRLETGIPEVTLVEQLRRDARAEPERWPSVALTLGTIPDVMVPPVSWSRFLDDVRRYLVEVVGLIPGSDLDTVLTAQHALLPARDRAFPVDLVLAHDFVAWHRSIMEAKDSGHMHDWEQVVDRLVSFGPGTFRVDDPHKLCALSLGFGTAIGAYQDWELASPVARAMPGHYRSGGHARAAAR